MTCGVIVKPKSMGLCGQISNKLLFHYCLAYGRDYNHPLAEEDILHNIGVYHIIYYPEDRRIRVNQKLSKKGEYGTKD